MKTRKQIAEQVHDELLEQIVRLNAKISFLRLDGKDKEKERLMIVRDNLQTELGLLEKEERLA